MNKQWLFIVMWEENIASEEELCQRGKSKQWAVRRKRVVQMQRREVTWCVLYLRCR